MLKGEKFDAFTLQKALNLCSKALNGHSKALNGHSKALNGHSKALNRDFIRQRKHLYSIRVRFLWFKKKILDVC